MGIGGMLESVGKHFESGMKSAFKSKPNAEAGKAENIGKDIDTRSTAAKAAAGFDAAVNPKHKSTKPTKPTPAASEDKDHSEVVKEMQDSFKAIGDAPSLPFKTGPESLPNVPSAKHGIDYVPKTEPYLLHEGEKVVPKEENKKETAKHSPEERAHFHRAMSHLHGGALHRHLGIPEGEPIPMEKKQEAANSSNPHVAAMGRMAVAMHGWSHGKK